ncbi:MAG TPA: glycosyl hydrolase [Thermoanaerobaculia bacterium]|nr:glycosyl hydrolase [Thermoanaerobaculia bacterium]
MRSLRRTLWVMAALCLATAFSADGAKTKKTAASAEPSKKSLSDRFEGLQFRNIGPYRGGRSTAVTGVRGQPLTFYFGGTGGGIWKTTDGGSNWEAMSDKDFKTGSVGSIAVSESDPNVVWVGMGESPIRGNVSNGDGVWKSTDAGHTWKNVGLKDTYQISRVIVHPHDPDLVYVAALGHVWGPNPERGIFRTEDGGKSWKKVLFVDEKTGAADLSMDPTNPRVLYAAFWQAYRKPWTLESGGPGSGLYKSTDGGDTWKKLTENGLPPGIWGRVGVAASVKPGRVFAIIDAQNDKGGLYRSDDGGEKWTRVSDDHGIRQRAWYYSWLFPDTKNADVLYIPNVEFYKVSDAGKSLHKMTVPHGDNHDLWIDPDDPNRMILGNDGGATITFNGGQTWSTQDNQPTAQFYRVITDDRFPYWVYGAQQDNSTVGIPSGVPGFGGITANEWYDVGGGESGWIAPDPRNPEIVYAGGYGGTITRFDRKTRQYRQIDPWPQLADGHPTKDLKYRYQWNAPIIVSKHDPRVLYFAAQKLMRSTDEGQTWTEASPDLTRNDPSKQPASGGPVSHDVTGVEVYDTIFALAESPLEAGVLWAGSDDGLIHVSRDDAKTWENVTPKGMPEWIRVNAIDASAREKGTAYVAATMYQFDDFKPYLYKTSDYGKTWKKIDSGIPDGAFTRVVREDPARAGLLYCGTERGLYVSFDDGASWQPFQRNLPPVPVTDLTVKNGDLVVATQGRAFWILDDLGPLRQWSESIAGEPVHLFPPRPAVRIQIETPDEGEGPPSTAAAGKNMPAGVLIDYWLKDKPAESSKITLEILSGSTVIRKFDNEKKDETKPEETDEAAEAQKEKKLEPKEGLNRFVWDMRILKPTLVPKAVFNEGDKRPPKVAPGSYQARLTVDGKAFTQSFEVRPNPTVGTSAADLKAQFDLLERIRDGLSQTHATVMKIRDLKEQIKSIQEHAEKTGKGSAIGPKAKELTKKLTGIEEELINPNIKSNEDDLNFQPGLDHEFTNLAGEVGSADAKPTASQTAYDEVLKNKLDAILAEFQDLVSRDLADFNRLVEQEKIAPVTVLPKVGDES